jgi:hypothetical protein
MNIRQDVRDALDRMSTPLDVSRLRGVTAEQDAACMRTICVAVEKLQDRYERQLYLLSMVYEQWDTEGKLEPETVRSVRACIYEPVP